MKIIENIVGKLFGKKADKDIKELLPTVNKILAEEKKLESLTVDELRAKTSEFKSRITEAYQKESDEINALKEQIEKVEDLFDRDNLYKKIDETKDKIKEIIEKQLTEILPEAFAVVKETAKRYFHNESLESTATERDAELAAKEDFVEISEDKAIWKTTWNAAGKEVKWEMIHYDVQLLGGIVLHQGKIAEMQTGEGKTLVSTLPVYLNALSGLGVHLVTVNDYLAKRDAAWMRPIYEFLGISVDCIDYYRPGSEERKKAYAADITYGTNNEFGFDYLRDNGVHRAEELVQRKPNYAIVDEIDSVLIDDARTPLIISGPVQKSNEEEFINLKPYIDKLISTQRQLLNKELSEAKKLVSSGDTKAGGEKLFRTFRGLPKNKALIKYLSEDGIKTLLQKTEGKFLQDNKREMPTIDKELYFTIDEQNNDIQLTDKGIDLLSKSTSADFFVLPDIATEISEVEESSLSNEEKNDKKEEILSEYGVKSQRIHTMNQLLKAYTLFEKDIQYVVMEGKVMIVDEQTGRIMDGRRFSDGLHQAIEAKEGVKIENATQTHATITLQNYFRMYSKLAGMTGTAITEEGEFWEIYKLDVVVVPTNKPILRDDRQDMVYKTAREKFNAVIDEIQKEVDKGRPVLVGTTSVEISELLSRMLKMRSIKHNVLNAKLHKKEADIVAEAGIGGTVTIATNMAGRGTDIKISEEVKANGGLAIIGTERHDSRRVDRQLRGRSGRQGDPGSSQFFVSLEDNLMRLFGSERTAKYMDKMGLKEGEVIQHSMITKMIERAQKKVEENNFGARKRVLEYDDVMNSQREVIYRLRRNALMGERLSLDIANMIYDTSASIVESFQGSDSFEDFKLELIRTFKIDSPFTESEFSSKNVKELTENLADVVLDVYSKRKEENRNQVFTVVKNVYENNAQKFENLVVPFSDGQKTINIYTKIEEAYESEAKTLINDFEKNIVLAIIDENWKQHLRQMDELKQSSGNARYEQKDPVLIYKFEAYELFKKLIEDIYNEAVSFLLKGELPNPSEQQNIQQSKAAQQQRRQKLQTTRGEDPRETARKNLSTNRSQQPQEKEKVQPRSVVKIGRNEKVIINNLQTGESKELKYKQAIPLIDSGWVLQGKV